MMRTAVIDIGTNTFHLLVAEHMSATTILHKEKIPVRIGMGGISKGYITEDAIERAVETLQDFKRKLDELEVKNVIATATSAVRNASNQLEFVEIIKEKTDLDISVLSGEEEAFLIHQGVRQFVEFNNEVALIVDIGGGSIEFILANDQEVKWLKSYEIGGQRLIDQFHKSDPIKEKEIFQLNDFLSETLIEVYEACKDLDAKYMVGSSGSFDTFWDIYRNREQINATVNPELTRPNFMWMYSDLVSKNKHQRLLIPGMIPMRVDMIVGAAVVTKHIMDNCSFDLIKVSPFALKEGVLSYGLPNSK